MVPLFPMGPLGPIVPLCPIVPFMVPARVLGIREGILDGLGNSDAIVGAFWPGILDGMVEVALKFWGDETFVVG